MGCGSSSQGTVSPATDADKSDDSNNNTGNKTKDRVGNGHIGSHGGENSPVREKAPRPAEPVLETKPPLGPVPKAISFEIGIADNSNTRIDSIISKHPPKRLKRLEPLDTVPDLTPEAVEEKLRQAEEKRRKQLEKKVQVSRRSSRLHRDLIQAREFEKTQQTQVEIEEKQKLAETKRVARLQEIEEKKRQREERARQIRERAKKVKQGEDGLDFEVEKDEAFNAEDDDSWLEGDNNRIHNHGDREDSAVSMGERIYSGRESPHKTFNPRSSAEQRARMSAGTTDSFDYAFQRDPTSASSRTHSLHHQPVQDDFFDS